jgi:hypothetical protein
VTFGMEENCRMEYLSIEVAHFKSSYHAILGRPMLARFMAIPHYTYLVLKMPAPRHHSLQRPAHLVQVRQRGPGDRHDERLLRRLNCHGGRSQEGRPDQPRHPGAEEH